MKKYIYAFIATICLPFSTQAQVDIETTFTDEAFREIIATFDTDGDGSLSQAEIKKITSLPSATMKNKGITTLAGIENLTALKTLYCENNNITTLDLSQNNALTSINVSGNKSLTSITLPTDKTKLTRLHVDSNALSAIDVTGYDKLTNIWCQGNEITSLTVTSPVVTELYANNNKITEVDITACTALKNLRLYRNPDLEGVDVSKNENLVSFEIFECSLKSIDVTNCTKLVTLKCSDNQIEEIDLSKNEVLETLNLHENKLTEVDFSKNPLLRTLAFYDNQISEAEVSHLTDLTYLRCNNNLLKELDVSTLTKLTMLTCDNNQITKLDVTNCPDLVNFECDNNQLTTLDLSKNTNLAFKHDPGRGKYYKISPQTAVIDAVVIGENREKVALPLVPSSDDSEITYSQFSDPKIGEGIRLKSLEGSIEDNQYLVVADDTKADVDLYGKTVTYIYNVPCGTEGATEDQTKMNVTITTYPYVMYVNPLTETEIEEVGDPTQGGIAEYEKFYSGTIYLDYDSYVDYGAELYAATGIEESNLEDMLHGGQNPTPKQIVLQKSDLSDILPSETPAYVKTWEPGYYAFNRFVETKIEMPQVKQVRKAPAAKSKEWETFLEQIIGMAAENFEGNKLQGTLKDLSVDYQAVLTLGREMGIGDNGTGVVGFWRYRGDKVAAHRAYLPANLLTNPDGGDVKGFALKFANDATGIRQIESNEESGAWYNLQGVQMAAPTQKGIYIRNGKKLIVR